VEKIHQQVCHVKKADKHALLEDFLQEQEDAREMDERTRTLIFSRTKHGADKLSKKLSKAGFKSDAIHGNKSQNARQRALDGFREGRVPVLVATDVAARGIDVKNITLVVNFDLPDAPDTYVHRIGRTARAEAHGRAVTFVEGGELRDFGNIEKFVGREIELHTAHAYHDAEAAHAKPQPKQNGGQRKGRGAKAAHFYTKRQTGGGKRSGRRPNRAARSR
jgi:ATP-dependent RNA helicase RhlE